MSEKNTSRSSAALPGDEPALADAGPVKLQMPRDRNASFDSVTVPKHVHRLDGLTEQVVSLDELVNDDATFVRYRHT